MSEEHNHGDFNEDALVSACDPTALQAAAKDIDDLYVAVTGDSCNVCAAFRQEVEANEFPYPILDVSAEACPLIADHYNVRVVPTVMKLKRGQVVQTHEGYDALEKMKRGE